MFETSTVEHVAFTDTASETTYTGRHTGFERLPAAVTHERSFHLARTSGALSIVDRLTGSGQHKVAWHFHFAPGVAMAITGSGRVTLSAGGRSWALAVPSHLQATARDAWYSPSYGVRMPCLALDLTADETITETSVYRFEIAPDA